MRINLGTLGTVALLGTALVSSGCAGLSWRNPLAGASLPSPWATVRDAPTAEAPPAAATPKPAQAKVRRDKEVESDDSRLAMELIRGRNLEQAGSLDQARRVYEDLRSAFPANGEVAHRLGVVADRQRRHTEAEGLFLEALSREPRNPEFLADLGYCYFLQGQLVKAESALLKASTIDPKNPRYRNNLGLVAGHLGRYDLALENFKAAGSDADAYFNLAFVYAAKDQADKAKQCFQMAIGADPTHSRAREALRSFEEYDRTPPEQRDEEFYAEDGVRYVPYVEGATSDGNVQAASAQMSLPSSRDVSRTSRALQMESRGLLNRNMQSQRNDSQSAPGVAE
ncbi:MAG: tetratricopeptide repeat protein [Pirellulaceae bacterium]|nr:tetratricopeptide repeat protein [Pirellulaceae bacterium]